MDSTIITTACFSFIVTGAFADLDTLARAIAATSKQGHLHITLTAYGVGWRLQVASDGKYFPDMAYGLAEQHIREGLAVDLPANELVRPTVVYTVEPPVPVEMEDPIIHTQDAPFCSNNDACPCHTDAALIAEHVVKPFMAGLLTSSEGVNMAYGRLLHPEPQDDEDDREELAERRHFEASMTERYDSLPWRNCVDDYTLY